MTMRRYLVTACMPDGTVQHLLGLYRNDIDAILAGLDTFGLARRVTPRRLA